MRKSIKKNKPAAIAADAGTVNNQANKISPITPQRTCDFLWAAPTPIIEELTTCVVLTGPPNMDAVRITIMDESWEVKLWMGLIL
jgi:hypothetical protein